jgi:TolB protein
VETEMRLYDLTTPDQRLIATRKFELPVPQARRLAHKVADEIVLQFTGEAGVADTKLAYVVGPLGSKEIQMADYDGNGALSVTRNGSINLSPVWSPDARSLAFTSFMKGYPDLYRAFPFERRPEQTLAAFIGINSSPSWSPDGRTVAMTLSKDGNPEIYVLTIANGTMRRLTRHAGIDTEPTWSPNGQQIAFISDRNGSPGLYVMDTEGSNIRQLTSGGFHTQPRWSPKGDAIVYTSRQGTHDLWAINPDGSNPRRLTTGPGDNQGATWAPNGRHLAFQSNRSGRWQIFTMLADGTEQNPVTRSGGEATSPSWSPRLP